MPRLFSGQGARRALVSLDRLLPARNTTRAHSPCPMSHDTLGPSVGVVQACACMGELRCSAFFVLNEQGSVLGVVTEQDIVRRVVAEGKDPKLLCVSDSMTKKPLFVPALGNAALEDEAALNLMSKGNFRHVPVVDAAKDQFIRSVDIMHVASAAIARRPSLVEKLSSTAKKFMRMYSGTVSKNEAATIGGGHTVPSVKLIQRVGTTVEEASKFMRDNKLSAVLVASPWKTTGIVTESDIAVSVFKV